MGTYNIPRNVKGEGRILFIFSTKSLIYTGIGGAIGVPFHFIFAAIGLWVVGFIMIAVFALLGFIIGTFKIPEIDSLKFTKKVGGLNIDEVIKRALLFRKKGKKIYLYTKEEEK